MVLSAQIRSESGESVGTFALNPTKFGNEQPGWRGEVTLELDGQRYATWVLLVPIGQAKHLAREGE